MSFQDHSPRPAADLLRPYLLVAVFAFALGFSAYLALGWTAQAAAPSVEAWPAPASAPAEIEFVDERHI